MIFGWFFSGLLLIMVVLWFRYNILFWVGTGFGSLPHGPSETEHGIKPIE